jgi:hypothetical protein
MTAKITLIGQPQGLRIEKDIVTFRIITGPASNTAPKGLTLFKATAYVVQCAMRHDLRSKSNRGRASERDKSELVIEGYQEPRIGEDGKPYVAVVALSVASTPEGCPVFALGKDKRKNLQAGRKLEQLREEVVKAEDAVVGYNANAACDHAYGAAMTRPRRVPPWKRLRS